MQPWEELAKAAGPDGETLVLSRRGDEFAIRVRGALLMSSRQHASEETLAIVACREVADRPKPAVLVGGLGMGFTLRAALDRLPRDSKVVVAELVPAIVEWNRGPLADLAKRPLEDARVEVAVDDVRRVLGSAIGRFDAILLDVDNGPAALTTDSNAKLYGARGVEVAAKALKAKGVLLVWSAGDDPRFVKTLERAGLQVEVEKVTARHGGGQRHVLFIARRR